MDLRYRMLMALNAADLGHPICDQAARICAEIAEQHCAELHGFTPAPPERVAEIEDMVEDALPSDVVPVRTGGGPAPR
ncbi:MAG TPA: hypothetical protein VGL20_07750 [Candidatus Dormibacteraeota bacterium]|jgi:hypothetical protein